MTGSWSVLAGGQIGPIGLGGQIGSGGKIDPIGGGGQIGPKRPICSVTSPFGPIGLIVGGIEGCPMGGVEAYM